jgi:hypothetical protein
MRTIQRTSKRRRQNTARYANTVSMLTCPSLSITILNNHINLLNRM